MSDKKISSLIITLVCAVLLLVLVLVAVVGSNSSSEEEWNDGVCTKCEAPYELRAVSIGLRYYSCPNCGHEVQRYGTRG